MAKLAKSNRLNTKLVQPDKIKITNILIIEDDIWFAESLRNMLISVPKIRKALICRSETREESKKNSKRTSPNFREKSNADLSTNFANFNVKILANPEKFFDLFETFAPDLIIADVLLGAKNLFVLLNEMQSYVDTRQIPLVILSSVGAQIRESDVREFNVKKVLDKTDLTPEVLRETVSIILNKVGDLKKLRKSFPENHEDFLDDPQKTLEIAEAKNVKSSRKENVK